jgi:serine/threonine protein kinase
MEENYNKENERGFIKLKDCSYYIINELSSSGGDTKMFSAVKYSTKNGKRTLEESKFCIRYISKNYIIETVFGGDYGRSKEFFDNIYQSYMDLKHIKHMGIQDLKDYVEDDDAIYIIFEFCEWSLKDYVGIVREPNRQNPNFPFEKKYRELITQILEVANYMHMNYSQCFGGLLNINDMMVSEVIDTHSQNTIKVKFPHPFFAHLYTKLKMFSKEFPPYYPPEIYEIFEIDENDRLGMRKDIDNSVINSFINPNFDMWALGFLIYEILFDEMPVNITDLRGAQETLNKEFRYKVRPHGISYISLRLINHCLQYDTQDRIQSNEFNDVIDEMKKDLDDLEVLGDNLRKRMLNKNHILVSFAANKLEYYNYKDN